MAYARTVPRVQAIALWRSKWGVRQGLKSGRSNCRSTLGMRATPPAQRLSSARNPPQRLDYNELLRTRSEPPWGQPAAGARILDPQRVCATPPHPRSIAFASLDSVTAMKTARRAIRFSILFLAAASFAAAPLLEAASKGCAQGPSSQDPKTEFRTQFHASLRTKDVKKMGTLIRQYNNEAIDYVIETAEAIANAPNDTFFERMDGLRQGWRDSIKTDFVDNMERYFSLLDPAMKRERTRMKAKYFKRRAVYVEAARKKDTPILGVLGLEFEELGKGFEEVGDRYFASDSWSIMGQCYDEHLRGNEADLIRACIGFKGCIDQRDAIDLQDRLYKETKPRLDWLLANGFGNSSEGAEGAGSSEPVVRSAAITAQLDFEIFNDLKTSTRPNYSVDDFYPMWSSLSLTAKGSSTSFSRLKASPKVLREGSANVGLDLDDDGKGDTPLALKGKIATVEFELDDEIGKRKWACQYITGLEKDFYQGMQINLQPTDNFMTIYLAPAASLVGELNGTKIRIIDEDLDGIYGGPHASWGNVGITGGKFQPEFDSVLVGKEKMARPWSRLQQIGDQWYEFEIDGSGLALSATPIELQTSTLKLKYKGGKPTYMIVKGSAKFEDCFFNITSKGTEVPVGRYELYVGELRKGKKLQAVKALILPGETTQRWNAEVDKTTEIELGAPYGFDFSFTAEGDEVIVDGKSVCIIGTGGERYDRPWGCVPRPEASARKAGSKRGGKPEKMGIVTNLTDGNHTYADSWRPLTVTVGKKAADTVEVQLTEKKNKLFGKIESKWKGQ
ncbi:MAG: hypothetical protein ACI835_005226 [Planctomycetota bacterium]|jgi:hypothetical protein